MKKTTVGLALLSLLGSVGACGGKVSAQSGGHTVVESGLHSNEDTADPYDADVVVRLTGALDAEGFPCTGILLTRTAILTSSRCVIGSGNTLVLPPVDVGAPAFGTTRGVQLTTAAPGYSELGHAFDLQSDSDLGADLAIVYLDANVLDTALERATSLAPDPTAPNAASFVSATVDSSNWGSLLGIHVERPSFVSPGGSTFSYASWAGEERELVTFQGFVALGKNWSTIATVAVTSLDIGSPLFSTRADGSRDPFGIMSGGDGEEQAFFVDVTSTQNSGWIRDHVIDRSHDGKAKWNAMHPPLAGQAEWWLGEDEYSGPCRTVGDADCDHWIDVHDNCPTVVNHDQADADDDGIGDACSGK